MVANKAMMSLLGVPATVVVGGVGKMIVVVMKLRINSILLVEADAEGFRGRQALQNIHVVGDQCLSGGFPGQVCIPTCPGGPALGKTGIISV